MRIIDIKYPKGQMTVNLGNFFPASMGYIKRLLAIIDKDQEHREEHLQSIVSWLIEEKKQCEILAKEYANKYMDAKTKVYEAEPKVQRMKEYLDSVATWKKTSEYREKFKVVEKEYKQLKDLERYHNSSFKKFQSRKEKLQKNIENMEGVK